MIDTVALITGPVRGIWLATAALFHAEGRRVVLLDRDSDELLAAAATLPGAMSVTCDVSIPQQVAQAVAEIEHTCGRLDILVNNAGVADFGPLADTDFARWRRVMDTNLDGVFLMSQACLPLLSAGGGAIMNIASISGLRASTLRLAYGTSKAAVIHLTKQQAAELGEFGIRANCVCPARPGQHETGTRGSFARNPRGLPRRDPAEPLRNRARDRRSDLLSCQRKSQLRYGSGRGLRRRIRVDRCRPARSAVGQPSADCRKALIEVSCRARQQSVVTLIRRFLQIGSPVVDLILIVAQQAGPCYAPQHASYAASPLKYLPPARAAGWTCCSAAASASAQPLFVPVNIPRHCPIPAT
jgi:NAD(P)-dependent dehydrogenase (short-subunit alcohol dehydrogenase family)